MTLERLEQFSGLEADIDALQEEIRLREGESHFTSSNSIVGGSPKTNSKNDPTAMQAQSIERLKDRLAGHILERDMIRFWIESIPDHVYRKLFRHKYVEGLKWRALACEMNYSISHVKRLYKASVLELGLTDKDDTK